MAGTKRKADVGTGNDAQKSKRSRASEVGATAASDRPRRSRGSDSTAKPTVPIETAKERATTKAGAAKGKEKTTKAKPVLDEKEKKKAEKVKEEPAETKHGKTKAQKAKKQPTESTEGPKKVQNVKKEPAAVSKVQKKAAESEKLNAKEPAKQADVANGPKKKAPIQSEERGPGEIRYWLMKAEPESRIEKGVDVKFSIHDLEARTKPEAWDGVRNPMAQKNMRNMKKGDLAFFYHSNCKVPGIAGLMQIVREHSIDESAFDEKHPYFDPKSSRDKPRWHVVHVEHLKTFDELVSLRELQKHAKDGGSLADMQTLRMSRLSVSQISAKEWEYILRDLVGINPKEIKAR